MATFVTSAIGGLNPYAGTGGIPPVPGNFGIFGPQVPNVPARNAAAAAANLPLQQGSIFLKSFEFIQHTYLCPPWGDGESDRYMLPTMLVFSVNESLHDKSTPLLTLPKVNQIMYESYVEYRELTNAGDPQAQKFKKHLATFGEKALEQYHRAKRAGEKRLQSLQDRYDGQWQDLVEFYKQAQEDMFCWLTRFGVLTKISFLGVIINTQNSDREPAMMGRLQYEDHYCVVNVGVAKRLEVANVFGPSYKVTTGSKLWLKLCRKPVVMRGGTVEYQHFQVVPQGSTTESYTSTTDTYYLDESGRWVDGWTWPVGVVMVPGKSSPATTTHQSAANIGAAVSERAASEAHSALPTLWVAMGFKH